jgi:AcrR family transcriptional regulator
MNEFTEKKSRRCCSDEEVLARREEILQTATELFAEQGFSDAVTQALAERLQVGKGTIYRHFPSKRELFLAAADRVMQKLRAEIEARTARIEDGLERLSRAISAYLSFFAEHPNYVEMLIQERAQFKDRKKPTFFVHREASRQRWHEVYRTLIAQGRLRDIPVERISNVISNVVYGTMFTNYFTGQEKPSDVQAAEILDIVFHGILSESERRRHEAAGPDSAKCNGANPVRAGRSES